MTVRISATDWYDGGNTADDSVQIAKAFAEHGADALDVSTGQVVKEERPAYGRTYQTPYADRIRNEVGIATIAVGAISSWDDVNSILLAGRADLCALGRTHRVRERIRGRRAEAAGGRGATWRKRAHRRHAEESAHSRWADTCALPVFPRAHRGAAG